MNVQKNKIRRVWRDVARLYFDTKTDVDNGRFVDAQRALMSVLSGFSSRTIS
jgi:hypothetical protein